MRISRITIAVLLIIVYYCEFGFAQKIVNFDAVMLTTGKTTLYDNNIVGIYGFGPTLFSVLELPAPILYANEGDSVIVHAHNHSRVLHTVHLHGLDVDTRNDGDPMTSFSIDHDEDTTYSFRATHAGTYIYHCHFQDVLHLQMGMYGLVIIRSANGAKTAWTNGPAFDKEYAWLTSELDKTWHDLSDVHDEGDDNTVKHPKYLPKYFLINGKSQQQLSNTLITIAGKVGEKIYLRLANIGFYTNRFIFPAAFNATAIDSDGRPLPTAIKSDTIELMPGERYGVMLSPEAIMSGTIAVNYVNMNTNNTDAVEKVPFIISGSVAVEDKQSSNLITLSPNPADKLIRVNLKGNLQVDYISIVNALGVGVEIIKVSQPLNEIEINTSNWIPGIYHMHIGPDTGILSKSFIISK